MSWMQLVVNLAQSLGWPAAAVLLGSVFRQHIIQVLGHPVKKLRVGPFEAEWAEQLRTAEKEIEKDITKSSAAYNQTMPLRLRSQAQQSPRGAVLDAFAEVESLLRTLVSNAKVETKSRPATAIQLTRLAADNDLISGTSARSIDVLRSLRNVAAHEGERISYPEALEFLTLADAIMSLLQERIDEYA